MEQQIVSQELEVSDYKNLLTIVNKAQIVGGEAEAVAILKFKLNRLIQPAPAPEPEAEKPTQDK